MGRHTLRLVTCAKCGETGELTVDNDYYTTPRHPGEVCGRCLLEISGLHEMHTIPWPWTKP